MIKCRLLKVEEHYVHKFLHALMILFSEMEDQHPALPCFSSVLGEYIYALNTIKM